MTFPLVMMQPWFAVAGLAAVGIDKCHLFVFEANAGELLALLAREAGKSPRDAVAELREAVDFLRYYANEGEAYAGERAGEAERAAREYLVAEQGSRVYPYPLEMITERFRRRGIVHVRFERFEHAKVRRQQRACFEVFERQSRTS